ncbi:MAG: PQQ-binding-like beta-propeller repeat protein [Acidobacteriota bacterium]
MNVPSVAINSYRSVLSLGAFGLLLLVFWVSPVSSSGGAQAESLFTAAQAARGSAVYAKQCAFCHGQGLEGATSTPLAGSRFMIKWGDGKHTVDDLHFVIRSQMPYGAAGTLTNQQYAEVVAFILQSNGYRAGSKALVANSPSLKRTTIAAQGGADRPDFASKMGDAAPARESAAGTSRAPGGKPTQAELNSAQAATTDWLMSNHDYGGQRFVDLKQINRQNAASLRPVAMYQAADMNAFHTNPVVSGGLMYITVKDSTMALDATTLKVRWRHDRRPKGKEGWPLNRGVAIKDGMVIRGTHDGYLIALDAATGKLIWDRALVDMTKNEGGFTMAPVVFEDLILIGPAGSELGVKGWVGAFKLSNGEQVWRFNTVPDDGEPGSETWEKADAKLKGGGAVWAPLSLDVEQGLVYVPVANPAPDFYGEARPGKNLYTCSMVALDVRTGKLKWFYQLVPHDLHDWDTTQVSPLFTTTIAGKTRRLVATVGKDGLLHVLDRETHQQVYEVPVTTRLNTDLPLTREGVRACPGVLGGVQWNGPAFNPGTNMLYVNAVDWCGTFNKADEARYVEGQFYMGGGVRADPPDKSRGWLTAVDASTGAVRWKYESPRPLLAAVTTTSANLIFTGELLGDFMALDGKTGEVLYRFNTGGRMNGGVVTYAINGKQYVAVATGAANAFWAVPPGSATIIVFALPNDSASQ